MFNMSGLGGRAKRQIESSSRRAGTMRCVVHYGLVTSQTWENDLFDSPYTLKPSFLDISTR